LPLFVTIKRVTSLVLAFLFTAIPVTLELPTYSTSLPVSSQVVIIQFTSLSRSSSASNSAFDLYTRSSYNPTNSERGGRLAAVRAGIRIPRHTRGRAWYHDDFVPGSHLSTGPKLLELTAGTFVVVSIQESAAFAAFEDEHDVVAHSGTIKEMVG